MSSTSNEFRTAAETAYEAIRGEILCGKLQPGEKLRRREMANISGVSVIPVIEALHRLEEDGLVESKPLWGSRVIVSTPEKILDACAMRLAIECQAVRMLATGISPEEALQLRTLAQELDKQLKITSGKKPGKEIAVQHTRFHSQVVEFTRCPSFVRALRRINLFEIIQNLSVSQPAAPSHPADWHMKIVAAIATQSPDKADAAMRTHLGELPSV